MRSASRRTRTRSAAQRRAERRRACCRSISASAAARRTGKPGLYALELVPGREQRERRQAGRATRPARLLANVTDLGVVAKRGASSALVWVTRLSNGALVAGAAVELLDAAGGVLAQRAHRRARPGALRALPPAAAIPSSSRCERRATSRSSARTGCGATACRRWQLGVREGDDDDARLFVHTDRGVYRPGERVLVHGLVRRISDTAPARVPSERDVSLVLEAGTRSHLSSARSS